MPNRELESPIWMYPMPDRAEIVNIKIRKELDGYFVVTSTELPGLVLAHTDIHVLCQDIPVAIVALYKANFGVDVQVIEAFPASADDVSLPPAWMVMRPRDGAHTQ